MDPMGMIQTQNFMHRFCWGEIVPKIYYIALIYIVRDPHHFWWGYLNDPWEKNDIGLG